MQHKTKRRWSVQSSMLAICKFLDQCLNLNKHFASKVSMIPVRILSLSLLVLIGFSMQAQSTVYVNDNSLVGDVYTSAAGNDANTGGTSDPFATIQFAVDQSSAGDTIYVDVGDYLEDLLVNKADLIIIGGGVDQSVIDHSGQPGNNNSGVNITSNGIHMKGFTVIDNDGGSVPRYGLKVGTSSITTDDVVLENMKVAQSFRTGFDLARPKNITLKNVWAVSNGGAGIFMSNPEGAVLESVTTSGNPWTGVSISSRSDWPGDATGVIFSGTNSFGESTGKNGGVQIESDNTLPISWGNNIADGKDVTIQNNELAYALSGPTTNSFGSIVYAPYFRFYQTVIQAQSAAGVGPDHVNKPRYIQDANCSVLPAQTNFYVFDFPDTAMTIQAAIDAAVDSNAITVNNGTYEENVVINKNIGLFSVNGKATTIIDGNQAGAELGTVQLTPGRMNVQVGIIGKGFHIKGIDGPAGIEKAAIYLQGAQNDIVIESNTLEARGDAALLGEYNAANNGIVINANMITGQTFNGANPAGVGFGAQFALLNVPRQAVTFGGGSSTTNTMNFTFTNNIITTVTGGQSITDNSGAPIAPTDQGNTLVTLDVIGANLIRNNAFSGTTVGFAAGLRTRGTGYTIDSNTFGGNYLVGMATAANPVVAEYNYWGDPSGPYNPTNNPCAIGKYVPDNVDFSPFFADMALTILGSGGAPVTNITQATGHCDIQSAIDAANPQDEIHVAAGTYLEDVLINVDSIMLIGAGIDQSIIDHSGQSGQGNAGVYITSHGVMMKGFTVIDNDGGSVPRYGLKVGTSSITTDDVILDSVKVTQSYRTGFDLARPKNIILRNVFAIDNGGAGIFMTNTEGALIQDATTSGNPWTGVSISTRNDWAGDASNIQFMGTNSFAENAGDNGGVQLEMVPGKTISWSNDIADGKDVTIQHSELSHALSGPTVNAPYDPYVRFYANLGQAQSAAGGSPDHVEAPRYIQEANCSAVPDTTNFYVFDYPDTAMTVQAAIDAAVDGNTVNVGAGTFEENVNLNKALLVMGVDTTQTIIQGNGGVVVAMSAGNSAAQRTMLKSLKVTGGATGISVSSHNTLHQVLSRDNSSYGVSLGNLNDLVINKSCFTHNNVGLKIASTVSATNVVVDSSEFDYNTGFGWYSDANSGVEPDLDTVSVTHTSFNHNGTKGLYTERLSNALFENVEVLNSGTDAFTFANGFDINLKWKAYENIKLSHMTINMSGTGGSAGTALAIKARNDAPSYNSNPASLSNLILESNSIETPNVVGDTLTGLLMGNAVSGVSFVGTNSFTGDGNGFTNYIDPSVQGDFSMGMSSFDGTLASYINNFSLSEVEALSTTFDGKIGNVMTAGERAAAEAKMFDDLDTPLVGLVLFYNICPDGSCAGCYVLDPFNEAINVGSSQAPDTWYTDRYDPDSFYVNVDSVLVHSIAVAGGTNNRPGSFSSGFYDTQGKKFDLPSQDAELLSIDLYVPFSWATTGRRMAGLWGVAMDTGSNISGYPIIEFVSDNTDPRFRVYDNGAWIDMPLPCNFAYDDWHTLQIQLQPTGEFLFRMDDQMIMSTAFGPGSAFMDQVILQGHNTLAGVDYDILWDNFRFGDAPELYNDFMLPEQILIGSGISNKHMAVGQYCGINAGLKASKRFLGDVTPVGNVYQFGTGVSPTSSANTTPDPGTARWNYLLSVNLGTYTFNDLNVYLDIDFDPSDSLCQVGPYTANLSQFLISNGQGGLSLFQSSENLGFSFWQFLGDPNILPFDPYAEGLYNLSLRIENQMGIDLLTIPIQVQVGCEFVDPLEDLEPPMLLCAADTTINTGTIIDPWYTGMPGFTGSCDQPTTYADDASGLVGCGGTGTILRTWYNADSSETCVQTITIIDTVGPELLGCLPDTIIFANDPSGVIFNFDPPMANDVAHREGFENPAFESGSGSYQGWNDFNSGLDRVTSGTDGVNSKLGGYHGRIDATVDAQTGAFSRLGGYTSVFGSGFHTSLDIYIDLADVAVIADTYGWDLTAAVNRQSGGHLRDFIFHAASNASGNVLIGGSNNTNFTRRNDIAGLNHHEITSSGWYTFQWVFRDSSGALAVDLNLIDANGNLLFTETRYNAGDDIATTVGGNRYMWFTFLETNVLHIDNTELLYHRTASCLPVGGSLFAVGTTNVVCSASDDCSVMSSCSFDVTVVDTSVLICDTTRVITNGDWMESTTVTPSNLSGGWSGVNGALPNVSSFTTPVVLGQPYSFPTIFAVDSSSVIKAGNNIRYFHRSITLDTLVDMSARIKATFDDQAEIYVNGKLLAADYSFSTNNGKMPSFDAEFAADGTVDNGVGGNKAFDFVAADTMDNVFQPGVNDIIVVLRNLSKSFDAGGLSLSLQVQGCEGDIAGPDTNVVPMDTLCDTLGIVASMAWRTSTVVTASTFSGNWSGVMGNLPDTNTFTNAVTLGQPYGYQTIFPVDSSGVIRTANDIRYFHRQLELDSLVDISARLKSTFDDQIEVYVNGNLLAGYYSLGSTNGKLPSFDVDFASDGTVTNGVGGNKAFAYATSDTMDNVFKPGINDIIVVLRNLAKVDDMGGFSFSLIVDGCKGEVIVDTNVIPVDTLTTSIVSDAGWEKSTDEEVSTLSGNWAGASTLPPASTYTLPAIEGQPYSYASIDAIDSAKVIKTGNNITFFRREFELTDHLGLDARFRMNVDDGMEIYINGKLIARENNSGSPNFRNPHHDLMFTGGTSPVNGFSGGDLFDVVTAATLDTCFVTGVNEIVLAVRNKSRADDLGGFSFRMDLEKAGAEVIVKSAPVNAKDQAVSFDFDLYPNPTSGIVNVLLAGTVSGSDQIIVQDISGRIINSGSLEHFTKGESIQMDMSTYPAGVYMVRVMSGDSFKARRIIKN